MAEEVLTAEKVVNLVAKGADILDKLWNSLGPSNETATKLKERQDEIKNIKFKKVYEDSQCQDIKGISTKQFQDFVARIRNDFGLSEKDKKSLSVSALDAKESFKVNLASFKFDEGKGNIYHGRFMSVNKNGEFDVAFAMYTISFELPEKDTDDWYIIFWYVLPVSWKYKTVAHMLTSDQKDMLNEWCKAKLVDTVAQERSKESETTRQTIESSKM